MIRTVTEYEGMPACLQDGKGNRGMKRSLSWILILTTVLLLAVPSVALAAELKLEGRQHMTSDIRITTITATLSGDTSNYNPNCAIWWESGNSKLVTLIEYNSHLDGSNKAQATFRGRYNTPEEGIKVKAIVKDKNGQPISATRTVYVSGLTYLPQTGQDTRTLTIVGVLCAAMFAMAGVFYARRGKSGNA